MGDKKNIDRLFQEQFKNFEAAPNDAVWDTIQSKLDENNSNNKRIPVWIMFSAVAATLVFFVALSLSVSSVNENKEEVVSVPEIQNLINSEKFVSGVKKETLLVNHNSEKNVDSGLKNMQSTTAVNVFDLNKDAVNPLGIVTSTTVMPKTVNRGLRSENNNILLLSSEDLLEGKTDLIQKSSGEIIVEKVVVSGSNNKGLGVLKNINVITQSDNTVVYNDRLNTQNTEREISGLLEKDKEGNVESEEKTNNLYVEIVKENSKITNSNLQNESFANKPSINSTTGLVSVGNDNNIAELGVVSNSKNLDLNESAIADVEECIDEEIEKPIEKTIEEAIAELEEKQGNEDDKEEEVAFNKWSIASNIAPVYYNTLSSGSPIDSGLSGNKKKGKINMSYGIGIGYAINKKLTLRTGINKVSFGFDTEDVAVNINQETTDDIRGVKNISLSPAVASLNIASSDSFSIAQIPSSFSSLYNSSLNQRLGYLEVPVELSYKISDKKMKIDVIAGMSTFFLNENDIYTETNGTETYIGEANNLNKMSYSTNIGLGFNYSISKTFNFNFEPTFKYQLNAFSNDSGNFKPYILGVYTGFSFKF